MFDKKLTIDKTYMVSKVTGALFNVSPVASLSTSSQPVKTNHTSSNCKRAEQFYNDKTISIALPIGSLDSFNIHTIDTPLSSAFKMWAVSSHYITRMYRKITRDR